MYQVKKQSLCDWHVTKNGAAYAWITKLSNGLYLLTFREFGKAADYTFCNYKEAVQFSKSV